jgi:hypothetical protein
MRGFSQAFARPCALAVALCAAACHPPELKSASPAPSRDDAGTPDTAPSRPPSPPAITLDAPVEDGPRTDATGAAACPGGDVPAPTPCAMVGIVVDPAYAGSYSCYDLGSVPGVPMQKYGGLTLTREACSTTLLIGGEANFMTGKLYSIKMKRDRTGAISGFEGAATVVADAPYNDGGITFGPQDVLFFARWPVNELQQTRPGSMLADKVIDLDLIGVPYASASIGFVPPTLPGAGVFKLISWPGGQWSSLVLTADAQGTFDVSEAVRGVTLPGGPEGFVYVEAGSPQFPKNSMLVSEWSDNQVATYEIDEHADPVLGTRKTFLTGFRGPEGAYRDPATGDFFFSTWGQMADRVIVVRGFRPIVID